RIITAAQRFHTARVKNGPDSPETPFRVTPRNGHHQVGPVGPVRATTGLMRRSKLRAYSITSSAVASSVAGMLSPSAAAVLRLTTSSNLVGCSTGKSAGLAPLNILST